MKTKLIKDALKNYEIDMNLLANLMAKDLCHPDSIDEVWWVGEEVGGVACINDMYIEASDIVNYHRFGMKPESFIEWYDQTTDRGVEEKPTINLNSWNMGLRYQDLQDYKALHLINE